VREKSRGTDGVLKRAKKKQQVSSPENLQRGEKKTNHRLKVLRTPYECVTKSEKETKVGDDQMKKDSTFPKNSVVSVGKLGETTDLSKLTKKKEKATRKNWGK